MPILSDLETVIDSSFVTKSKAGDIKTNQSINQSVHHAVSQSDN